MTKEKYKDAAQEDLAAYVVVYRTLGINKQLAIDCMIELANRKITGSDFDYEKFIDDEVKKIPKINTDDKHSKVLSQGFNLIKSFIK